MLAELKATGRRRMVPLVKRDVIDTEFEVVGNHYRPGERHRDPKLRRWIFTGRNDPYGRPLWYRPPLLNRWAFGLALLFGYFALQVAVAALDWLLQHRG